MSPLPQFYHQPAVTRVRPHRNNVNNMVVHVIIFASENHQKDMSILIIRIICLFVCFISVVPKKACFFPFPIIPQESDKQEKSKLDKHIKLIHQKIHSKEKPTMCGVWVNFGCRGENTTWFGPAIFLHNTHMMAVADVFWSFWHAKCKKGVLSSRKISWLLLSRAGHICSWFLSGGMLCGRK